ncbi:vitamin K epoxide reductase family protein [Pedobacter mendelii]|uniref:Peptidase C39 domain-containing protein n=1 Tax=Pedobacter mendelii TaxID=1908240 RepID=A0ABQ2BC33_9SPHI|nr:vitamin K epoxide reductase family protein [Pedobacter mendelii]GGI22499.1 hypothetical protein GCM10008119_02950 [Pedobacter mendelii]
MNLFNHKKQNLEFVTNKLVKKLNIKINFETISQCLQKHPNYPSLLAISDVLTEFKIPNRAYQINKSSYEPTQLSFPLLAHLKESGGRFIFIENITSGIVYFSDENSKSGKILEEDFLLGWDGISIQAEKNVNSGEKNYYENFLKYFLSKLKFPSLIVLISLIFYLSLSYIDLPGIFIIICTIKLIGLGVSVLLLIQSINSNNPFIQNLCGLSGNNDCNSILRSDESKITSWLSWSEMGFFYFAGSLLTLLIHSGSFGIVIWLNVIAIPYTIYSIRYQFIKNNWCLLCCIVQVLLWIEFFAAITSESFSNKIHLQNISFLTLGFAIPIVLWASLKPSFLKAEELKLVKGHLELFKYNSELFKQRLTGQPRYAISDDLMPIVLGNSNGETVITIVSSPTCGPCSKAHEILSQWLEILDDLKVNILFSAGSHKVEARSKVARHLMELGQMGNTENLVKVLADWYNGGLNYDQLIKKYPVIINNKIAQAIENQKNWCGVAEIMHTPTILINGYKLPEPYRLEDLKYLVI